jgi:chromate transporter
MRRELVQHHRWISDAEFTQNWTLSKASPGLSLIGLTALNGRSIDGWAGLALAMAGLSIPSVGLTVLLAAGFAAVRGQPIVATAIDGVMPATIGLTLALMVLFVRRSVRSGKAVLVDLAVFGLAVVAGVILVDYPTAVVIVGGIVGWLMLGTSDSAPDGATPVPLEADA